MCSNPLTGSLALVFQHVTQAMTGDALAASPIGGIPGEQLLLLGAAVIVLTLVMRTTRRRWRRSVEMSRDSVRRQYEELKHDRSATREAGKVLVELDQLARQVHGRLDTQFAKLETLIGDADLRIDKLSRLIHAARGTETLDITLDSENPDGGTPTAGQEDHPKGMPRFAASVGADRERPKCDDPTPHASIYRLADRGLSPTEIAQQVSRTTGEVELILSLRKIRGQSTDRVSPATPAPLQPRAHS